MAEKVDGDHGLSTYADQRPDSDDDDVSLDASFFLNEKYGERKNGTSDSHGGHCQAENRSDFELMANKLISQNGICLSVVTCYQLQKFTLETQAIELYCLQSSLTDYDLTGQLVWPGAQLLAEYLLQKGNDVKGFSVIELGAGLGLTGLLCARLCEHVVMTDYNETVIKVMQRNVDHQISTADLSPCKVEVQKLDWSDEDHIVAIEEKYPEGFDLIIGADICYQQSCIPPLFGTIQKLLKQERARPAVALLGYVSRWKSMDEAVCCEALKLDLEIKEIPGTRKEVVSGLYEGWIYEILVGT